MKICDKRHLIDGTEFCRSLDDVSKYDFLWVPVKCVLGPWAAGKTVALFDDKEFAVFDDKREFMDSAHADIGCIFDWELGLSIMMDWDRWEETMIWIMDDREFGDILLDPCKCPACGGEMIERTGPHTRFYGCSNFPKCRHSFNTNCHEYNVLEAKKAISKAIFG